MVPIDEATVVEKGALGPGQMIGVHMGRGELCRDEELKDRMAEGLPFSDWVGSIVDLEEVTRAADEDAGIDGAELRQRQIAAGYSIEGIGRCAHPRGRCGALRCQSSRSVRYVG